MNLHQVLEPRIQGLPRAGQAKWSRQSPINLNRPVNRRLRGALAPRFLTCGNNWGANDRTLLTSGYEMFLRG